ncbi:acetyl/propionyl/methylcrotonyl-CoA carboxylase subunit alpha [Mesorhizobium australicum]|uniref:Geranyl-CoA carboxylase alpha subunit n=1 Tax=Mesorhizobium australicum TaxID=536018 RepID=A0A1X7PMU8_9HYPH|nr:biotin carboxylase N-terminal domain-containing protein [Mesorhizobium australicum]SMH52200.1 geranyl-CoA carboxylase alpha subunit [Mesorhizobium australicum]
MNESAAPHPAAATFSPQAGRRTNIRSLLVANRGEIACRIMRTAKRMGIATVAVYSDADADAPHVRLADQAVRIGGALPAESYLNASAVIDAARTAGADAVHPGYGFLSENAAFAEACAAAGLVFVGPPPAAIHAMGDKARAKRLMAEAGVPVVPGYEGEDQSPQALAREAERIGFSVLIKAAAGGGGRGMRRVDRAGDFAAALESARREAENALGDPSVLIEKLVIEARHIEIQVFADRHGNAIHLGERDCSAQRRHQKIVEEAPSPFVTPALRLAMGADAVRAAKAVGYEGAGTVEFIVAQDGTYHFLEMNTRLQVEHPVTEMVTGFDLVEWQLRVAAGEALPATQDEVGLTGHAIEARLYAEDPYDGFRPQSGRVLRWRPDKGVRIDSGVAEGGVVTPFYDPMIAKVIAHGPDRAQAIDRLVAALRGSALLGIATNRRFLVELLSSEAFRKGDMTTGLIDRWIGEGAAILDASQPAGLDFAVAAVALAMRDGGSWFRSTGTANCPITLSCGMDRRETEVRFERGRLSGVSVGGEAVAIEAARLGDGEIVFTVDGVSRRAGLLFDGRDVHLDRDGTVFVFHEPDPLVRPPAPKDPRRIVAPVSGVVRALGVVAGQAVAAGDMVAMVEAMKMENALNAAIDGIVAALHVAEGAQVAAGQLIAEIEPGHG